MIGHIIGYIGLGMAGILVILLAAAVINTLRIKLPPPASPLAHSIATAVRHGERLARMIRIPSLSKREDEDLSEFRRLHRTIEELFPLVHERLERIDLSGNLLFRWRGRDTGRRPILFMAHQDVVPASPEGWTHPPFAGTIENGLLYGRGALDSKCNGYAQLEAIEQLLGEGHLPAFDVYVEMSINEEMGGEGALIAARYLSERGVRLSLAMDEGGLVLDVPIKGMDRPYAVIGVVEKGYMDVKVKAKSLGGHSSTPPRNTPIARLAEFVHEIETRRPFRRVMMREVAEMFAKLAGSFPFGMRLLLGNLWLFKPLVMAVMPRLSPFGEALLSTTCTFTMCGGSDAANVIPSEAYVVANLRTSPRQDCAQSLAVLERVAARHGLTLEVLLRREPSPCTDTRGSVYREVAEIIGTCFPEAGIAPYFVMGGTDARHFHVVTDNVLRFTPIRTTSKQLETCHAVDENVSISSLAEGVEFYKYFIRNWRG